MLAVATQHVHQDAAEQLQQVGQVMAQLMQKMQQLSQGMQQGAPTDPNIMAQVQMLGQTAMAETQRKTQKDQADVQLAQQKLQAQQVENTENNLVQERIKAAELSRDAVQLQHEQLQTTLAAQQHLQSNLGA